MRAWAAATLAAAVLFVPCCRGGGGAPHDAGAVAEEGPAPSAPGSPLPDALPNKVVKLYFPSSASDTLVAEDREIFDTASAVDRAKQILSELLSGPTLDTALPSVPQGTQLKQVYVLGDGTAYADFSSELAAGMEGGSSEELLAIYSIVDSVVLNVPEIRRLAILVDGKARTTLAGHIDLRRPFLPDRKLLGEPSSDKDQVRLASPRSVAG